MAVDYETQSTPPLPPSPALNPMASPYHKIPHHFNVLKFPPTSYQILPAVLPRSPFYAYNVHLQPFPCKSIPPPPPPPPSLKKMHFSLTPVPSGPRIPKSRSSVSCWRVKNIPPRSDNVINEIKWRPKNNNTKTDLVEKKQRWKNKRGHYQRNLPLETESTSVMIRNIPNKFVISVTDPSLNHLIFDGLATDVEQNKIKIKPVADPSLHF